MHIRTALALAAASTIALTSTACTTTEKVNVMQPGDQAMTCTQMKSEFARLDTGKADASKDKGVNGANVAAVLLFWPAAAGNYLNARDAENLVNQRRTHLMSIYNSKNCDNPANAQLRFMVPKALLGPVTRG